MLMPFSRSLLWLIPSSLLVFILASTTLHANPYAEIQKITSVQHSITKDSKALPPPFTASHSVELPHEAFPIASASAWYTFDFQLKETPQESLSLYLPLINMNASVYLNQQLIGASGSFAEPMSRFWHTPVLFYLPLANLKQGVNTIHIRLKASPPNDLIQLGHIYLGCIEPIYSIYSKEYFASYTIHLMALSAATFLGFIVLYLWFSRRMDEYLFFALACLTWATSTLNIVIHNPPFSSHLWEWMIQSTLSWMPIFVLLFIRRIINKGFSNIEKILWGSSTVFTVFLFFVPYLYFFIVANVWHFTSLLVGIYAVYLVASHYLKYRDRVSMILGLGFVVVALFALHDYLIVVGILGAHNRFLLDYAMPLLLLAIAIVLIRRFVDATLGLEQANATLEQRVQDAEKKIKDSYKVISELQASKAVSAERTRIFSDLHDDLGAKLLSLVYKSETDEQKHLAKEAMEGLREIVKRSPADKSLFTNPLAAWKVECQQRTKEHTVNLQWHEHRIPKSYNLSNTTALQLMQILREALSNALKHGDGKDICVRIQVRCGHTLISVRNHGQQLCHNSSSGSGRKNMERRIKSIGGIIRWRGGKKGGCHVIWVVPIGESE